eukprot:UN01797
MNGVIVMMMLQQQQQQQQQQIPKNTKKPMRGNKAKLDKASVTRGGIISLTLKSGGHYDEWRPIQITRLLNTNQIAAQQKHEDIKGVPRGTFSKKFGKLQLLRKVTFFPSMYPGYSQCTYNWV